MERDMLDSYQRELC